MTKRKEKKEGNTYVNYTGEGFVFSQLEHNLRILAAARCTRIVFELNPTIGVDTTLYYNGDSHCTNDDLESKIFTDATGKKNSKLRLTTYNTVYKKYTGTALPAQYNTGNCSAVL